MKTITKICLFIMFGLLNFAGISLADTTGDLLSDLTIQKTNIEKMYDDAYQNIYKQFQTSAIDVIKSINYQSLVCLGVMSESSFLQQMQNDNKNLKLSFLNSYSKLYTDASDIEQKNRIQKDSSVSLFASWSSYEIEKNKILSSLSGLLSINKQLSAQFQTSYENKIALFIKDVTDYTAKNQSLVLWVSSKINALKTMEEKFAWLSSDLMSYQAKLAGTGVAFFDKLQKLKSDSIYALDLQLQNLIKTNVKRYPILPMLSWELFVQKDYALWLYGIQFDEKLNLFLVQWYDNKEYISIKTQFDNIKSEYINNNIYQCSKFINDITFDWKITSINNKINVFSVFINQWWSGLSLNKTWLDFQKSVLNRFSSFSKEQQKSIDLFKTVIKQKITALLDESKKTNSQIISTGSVISMNTGSILNNSINNSTNKYNIDPNFYFSKPFTKNQKNASIKILQQLLSNINYYTWAINWVYNTQTKNNVYDFQMANWLLIWYEKRPQSRWWMGPATRQKLNEIIKAN